MLRGLIRWWRNRRRTTPMVFRGSTFPTHVRLIAGDLFIAEPEHRAWHYDGHGWFLVTNINADNIKPGTISANRITKGTLP